MALGLTYGTYVESEEEAFNAHGHLVSVLDSTTDTWIQTLWVLLHHILLVFNVQQLVVMHQIVHSLVCWTGTPNGIAQIIPVKSVGISVNHLLLLHI